VIDTHFPVDVTVGFPLHGETGALDGMKVTLSQGYPTGPSAQFSVMQGKNLSQVAAALRRGVTPVLRYWTTVAEGAVWHDGAYCHAGSAPEAGPVMLWGFRIVNPTA